jgi:hypothetical protein
MSQRPIKAITMFLFFSDIMNFICNRSGVQGSRFRGSPASGGAEGDQGSKFRTDKGVRCQDSIIEELRN